MVHKSCSRAVLYDSISLSKLAFLASELARITHSSHRSIRSKNLLSIIYLLSWRIRVHIILVANHALVPSSLVPDCTVAIAFCVRLRPPHAAPAGCCWSVCRPLIIAIHSRPPFSIQLTTWRTVYRPSPRLRSWRSRRA